MESARFSLVSVFVEFEARGRTQCSALWPPQERRNRQKAAEDGPRGTSSEAP